MLNIKLNVFPHWNFRFPYAVGRSTYEVMQISVNMIGTLGQFSSTGAKKKKYLKIDETSDWAHFVTFGFKHNFPLD